MTWTPTRPKPPYAWRLIDGEDEGIVWEDHGDEWIVPVEFHALSPVPARKSAHEEAREALARDRIRAADDRCTPEFVAVRRAFDRLLSEPEIDVERLRRAVVAVDDDDMSWDTLWLQKIATAYAKEGAE
jgi:hypothetical protein